MLSSRRLPVLVATLALAASASAVAPSFAGESGHGSPAPAASRMTVAASSGLHLQGRGYGHGHGLSQYGAQGAAAKGLNARQILAFYYPGTKRSKAGGNISVLLTENTHRDVVVDAVHGLKAGSVGGRMRVLTHRGAVEWRIAPAEGGTHSAIAWRAAHQGAWHVVRTVQGDAEFGASGRPITLRYGHGHRAYRGVLRSASPTAGSGNNRVTVNVLSLDSYLKSVVPSEMPALWHAAALQAQAVAARTYAAFERRQPLSRAYDICDSTACQVYSGVATEHATSSKAVAATHGEILVHRGAPAFTQFSASDGGWTAAGGEPYLVARKDPYDTAFRGWTATVSARTIQKAYPAIGAFASAKVLTRDGHGQWGGRVETLRLTGSAGSVTVDGDTFRSVFGLRSTWFTFG